MLYLATETLRVRIYFSPVLHSARLQILTCVQKTHLCLSWLMVKRFSSSVCCICASSSSRRQPSWSRVPTWKRARRHSRSRSADGLFNKAWVNQQRASEPLLAAHLSVTCSILTVLQGTHGCRVWSRPQVEAQAQQRGSGQMTLQLFNQVLLFLQLITLRQRKQLKWAQLEQKIREWEFCLQPTCCLYCSMASSSAAKNSVFSLSNCWICTWSWAMLSSFSFSCSCLQLSSASSGPCATFLVIEIWKSGFNVCIFMRERDPPGSLQKAVTSAMPQSPPRSCCRCRCLARRQWSARSVPPLLNTATHSLSHSGRWLEFLHSVAPAAA